MKMKKIIFLLVVALTLSACSPEELFGLLARSDVEQAADEQLDYASDVIKDKQAEMETLKNRFDEAVTLTDLTDEGKFGVAGRSYSPERGFEHEVLAVLPFLEGETFYEGWLVVPGTDTFVSTGTMRATADQKAFELLFSSGEDHRDYSQVVITLETVEDDLPEEHVMEGRF